MAIDPMGFPLDLTGQNPRNEVTGETRTLTSNEEMTFVPDGGPFFTNTLIVRSGTRILKPVVDYKCLHLLKEATIESGMDVSAIIHIIDTSVSTVTIQYQVIGGQYGSTVPAIRQLIENAGTISGGVNWNTQVYAKPDVFPPAPHFVHGEEFSSWRDVIMVMDNIHKAIAYKERASWNSVYKYVDTLIKNRVNSIDLSGFYTKSEVNSITNDLALQSSVYTKVETNNTFYTKSQVDALIGDIDGNETYYTENEINAKFLERNVADGTYATLIDFNRLENQKANLSSVYTRAQSDDRFADKTQVYPKNYIDANFTSKGTSFTKLESDDRYAKKDASYTKPQSDQRYALKSQIPQAQDLTEFMTRDEIDNKYLKTTTADLVYLRKSTADSVYAKQTDLEIIDVLNKRFNNYYTKSKTDEIFVTKNYLSSAYDTSSTISKVYGSKDWVSKTFLSQLSANSKFSEVYRKLDTKISTSKAQKDFATFEWTQDNFFTKTESDTRYYQRGEVDNKFPTKHEVSRDLGRKLDISAHVAALSLLNTDIGLRVKTKDLTANYYNKGSANSLFVTKNSLNNAVNSLQEDIDRKISTQDVTTNYYDKNQTDKKFTALNFLNNNFYTSYYVNSNFVRKNSLDNTLSSYATKAELNGVNNSLTSKFSNYYTKREADYRFYEIDKADKTFVKLKLYTTGVRSIFSQINTKQPISGMVNYATKKHVSDNFATKSSLNIYAKSADVSKNYISKSVYNADKSKLEADINTRATQKFVTSNYFTRSQSDHRYYSKVQADGRYATKAYADSTFNTKATFKAFTDKAVTKLDLAVSVSKLDSIIASKAARDYVRNFYVTKTSLNQYRTIKDADRLYLSKSSANSTYATKKWVEDIFTKEEIALNRFKILTSRIQTVSEKLGYKVGDLFLTTLNFSTSSQVKSHLGYGTWERYAMGRALVGYSPNQWVDGIQRSGTVNQYHYKWYSNYAMGYKFGTYKHVLSESEMPKHNHVLIAPSGYGFSRHWTNGGERLHSTTGSDAIQSKGGDQPHNNTQPSIIIGVWKRIG